MSQIVVILGADASHGAGLPMLNGIFDDCAVKSYLESEAKEFHKFMRDFIWDPRGINQSEAWRTLNLEEVLTMLRMWLPKKDIEGKNINFMSDQAPLNFAKNYRLQQQLLGCVYHSVFSNKKFNGNRDYNELIQKLERDFKAVTWASFNWDAKLEQAFYHQFRAEPVWNRFPQTIALLEGYFGARSNHLLLKLHGSVNWFRTRNGTVEYRGFGSTVSGNETAKAWTAFLGEEPSDLVPVIAEPSFFKHERIGESVFLVHQWKEFSERLIRADIVLIIGYSLPDGDAIAKQALLTCVARNSKVQFIIVNPSSEVQARYIRVLGASRVTMQLLTLSEYVSNI